MNRLSSLSCRLVRGFARIEANALHSNIKYDVDIPATADHLQRLGEKGLVGHQLIANNLVNTLAASIWNVSVLLPRMQTCCILWLDVQSTGSYRLVAETKPFNSYTHLPSLTVFPTEPTSSVITSQAADLFKTHCAALRVAFLIDILETFSTGCHINMRSYCHCFYNTFIYLATLHYSLSYCLNSQSSLQ